MIIAMCATRNWYFYTAVALYSILSHNKVQKVYLFIEDDKIPYIQDKRVKFININKIPKYVKETSLNYNTHYTRMSYTRCFFSKVLKEDKIIYLDVDALVVDNIQDLWNMDLEGNYIAGAHEGGEWDKHLQLQGFDDTYINSGVLVIDLKKTRKHKLDDKMIELLNTKKYLFPDQDVINIVYKGKIKHISNIYNSAETTGIVDNAKIIHYIKEHKGWIKESPRSEIWLHNYKLYIKNLFKGGKKMFRGTVVKRFTLGSNPEYKFEDLKIISRKDRNVEGELFVGDVIEGSNKMCEYLQGGNPTKEAYLDDETLETFPDEKEIEKEEKTKKIEKKVTKKTTTRRKTTKK